MSASSAFHALYLSEQRRTSLIKFKGDSHRRVCQRLPTRRQRYTVMKKWFQGFPCVALAVLLFQTWHSGGQMPVPNMVWIPPGTFTMGSPTNEANRELGDWDETQHIVTLTSGFYIGKYEVTQGEFLAIMGYNPARFQTIDGFGYTVPLDLNRPVESVS